MHNNWRYSVVLHKGLNLARETERGNRKRGMARERAREREIEQARAESTGYCFEHQHLISLSEILSKNCCIINIHKKVVRSNHYSSLLLAHTQLICMSLFLIPFFSAAGWWNGLSFLFWLNT